MSRHWCPSRWLDETCPVMADDPSDAIRRLEDGSFVIVPDESDDDPERETIALEPGQVVAWCDYEPRGDFEVTKHSDGTYTAAGEPSGEVTHWWLPVEPETLGDTLDELVREYVAPETTAMVGAYFWSNDVPFRFEIEDGKGRFVRCEGAN